MSIQSAYTPGSLMKQPKLSAATKSFEDYPDDDPGFSLDSGASSWPDGEVFPPDTLDAFPPDGEAKIDRSTGPKAVPAKDKAVPTVKAGKKGR